MRCMQDDFSNSHLMPISHDQVSSPQHQSYHARWTRDENQKIYLVSILHDQVSPPPHQKSSCEMTFLFLISHPSHMPPLPSRPIHVTKVSPHHHSHLAWQVSSRIRLACPPPCKNNIFPRSRVVEKGYS